MSKLPPFQRMQRAGWGRTTYKSLFRKEMSSRGAAIREFLEVEFSEGL